MSLWSSFMYPRTPVLLVERGTGVAVAADECIYDLVSRPLVPSKNSRRAITQKGSLFLVSDIDLMARRPPRMRP
jgi:hypothetical protein